VSAMRSSVEERERARREGAEPGLPRASRPAERDPSRPASGDSGNRETLAERYARMAHEGHEPRGVDVALRTLDLTLAGIAGVILLPLIATVALAIRLTSGRPVLYRGRRVGRAGRIFTMLKFRTLKPDAEARLGPYLGHELTRRTEAEVTRLGRVLRFMHLDELPQLWNVLRGDMSVVGPRPIRPAFFEELCEQIPQYWQRLVVEPGMTGFAQLRMTRETSWSEKLAHDLEYLADRSVTLYLRVVAATAWRVVTSPVRALAGVFGAR
jgi:lipopolysaccharide/colanic/teichoic acid biosynthesis glycosyltransferase